MCREELIFIGNRFIVLSGVLKGLFYGFCRMAPSFHLLPVGTVEGQQSIKLPGTHMVSRVKYFYMVGRSPSHSYWQ